MAVQYLGLNPHTGASISDSDHISQSIRDILLTPKNTRVMRRNYGSALPDLVDCPQNVALPLRLRAAVVMALSSLEPRICVTAVDISDDEQGAAVLTVTSTRADTQQALTTTLTLSKTA
ncbi:GPW/gp25 family protein [Gibbsiella dentisursi]|uniref:GPW/gp25 family protein n=1 Tax=Gibbsiella dentisursi TaxID=796890 RepID=A0ABP7M0V6_9GAMM